MRPTLVVLGLLVSVGCAEVPEADDLTWEDLAEPEGSFAYETIPNASGKEPAPPATAAVTDPESADGPRISVSRMRKVDPEDWDYVGTALCPFEVAAGGFPATNGDGSKFAYWVAETLSSSDGEDEMGTFRIVDVATDTVLEEISVFDGDPDGRRVYSDEGAMDPHCRRLRKGAIAQAHVVNAMLADEPWRTMEPLNLIMRDRALYYDEDPHWLDDSGEGTPLPPPAERPVELVHLGKTAALRIPGVKVLSRMDADWDGPWEQHCGRYVASLGAAYVDRESSLVTVSVRQQSGPCYCYAQTLMHPVAMTPSILATIDARPWPPRHS